MLKNKGCQYNYRYCFDGDMRTTKLACRSCRIPLERVILEAKKREQGRLKLIVT